MFQLFAHLSQTQSQGSPPFDLDIYIFPDALVRAQQIIKVDTDAATTLTPDTR
jgi:hypothetical protein